MQNIYYNEHEFRKILKLSDNNPSLSIEKFEEYIKRFPNDYDCRTFYISLLVKLRELSKAEIELAKLEEQIQNDYKYKRHTDKKKKTYSILMLCKVKLLFYQNKYHECYDYIQMHLPTILENDINLAPTKLFCKKELGLLNEEHDNEKNSYLFKQIIDYSEERFLEHIKEHLVSDTQSSEKSSSIFKESFPLEEALIEIKNNTPSNLRIYSGMLEDIYIYKYDFCGKYGNKNTDYFKVVAIHDTQNFITMYPCIEGKNWDQLDLNYLRKDDSKQKIISQIDKFNQRYKKTIDK